jgi:hypothetical protein
MNSILSKGKMSVENQTKTRVLEDSSLCPETSNETAQEFHIRKKILANAKSFLHVSYVYD